MAWVVQVLRSVRLALTVLVSLSLYSFVGAWLPWVRADGPPAPDWARATGFDRPFSAWPFLVGCTLLFLSTWACTWGRRPRLAAILRGNLPGSATALAAAEGVDAAAFLREQGFRGAGRVLRRFGLALWAGWLFHVGLLVMIAAVVVQQAFHDGGAFELAEGERARLSAPGIVFARERGPLAPARPPDLDVALVAFDPFLRQHGYAPDRRSRLELTPAGARPIEAALDRSSGVTVGDVVVYQSIPMGLTVNLEIPGLGGRAIHLRSTGERAAAAVVVAPGGAPLHFSLTSEHSLDEPRGTGRITVRLLAGDTVEELTPGQELPFGDRRARFVAIGRWAGFTWARNPGMPGVFLGFVLLLLGALGLVFPAAVAELSDGPVAARVHGRGVEVLARRWRERDGAGRAQPPSGGG